MTSILFAEDEEVLGQLVKEALELQKDFVVDWVKDGNTAFARFQAQTPDICILDVMMPVMDGFTAAKNIRAVNEAVPIIFLTARSQTQDVVKGFETGCDDYLKKPFSVEELVVRIRSLLRRKGIKTDTVDANVMEYKIGNYQFFPTSQLLKSPEINYNLTYKEAELLKELVINMNMLLDRKKVLLQLWGDDNFFNARNMDVYIAKLRKYLAHDPTISIINVRGYGYKLVEQK